MGNSGANQKYTFDRFIKEIRPNDPKNIEVISFFCMFIG